MKQIKDYTNAHKPNGKFAVGNPGGGRPAGSQNLTNLPRLHKAIGKRRGDLQLQMQDAIEDNMPMIVKNLIELCNEKNERVLLTLFGAIYPKMKDFDIDKIKDDEGKSAADYRGQLDNIFKVLEKGPMNENTKEIKENE